MDKDKLQQAYDTIIKMIDEKIKSTDVNDLHYARGLLDAMKIINDKKYESNNRI
jgi:hypothetical protein